MIFVDTNVLLDLITGDRLWGEWFGYARIEELDEMIRRAGVISAAIPRIPCSSSGRLSAGMASAQMYSHDSVSG